jgi:hypothetical protein
MEIIMSKATASAAGGAAPAPGLMQSRRGLLTTLAATPLIGAVALPALAEGDDAELFALEAEITRLHEEIDNITEARIDPHQEEFDRLLTTPATEQDRFMERLFGRPCATAEGYKAASAFSDAVDRESAIEEVEAIHEKLGPLATSLMAMPAETSAGRAAKVRVLLACVARDKWHGPGSDLDWEIDCARLLLGEYAGMSEAELAAM